MRRWDRLLDGYLAEYGRLGRSAGMEHRVAQVLDRWGRWMKRQDPRLELERVDADVRVSYVRAQSSFRAKSTVSSTLSVLRGMGEYLVRQGVWATNPLRWMKGPKLSPYSRLPKRLDTSQLQGLWREAASSRSDYQRHLRLVVLALLYGTGLRRGELERLELGSWDGEQGVLRIDGRKTGRERSVPVPALAYQCLEAYLPQRHNRLELCGCREQSALLVNRDGKRLSGDAISKLVHVMARRSGVALHSLHQFRHSCASDLLEAGVRLPEVQRILGHQDITSTVRYVHIADPQRRAAMSKHPINDWLRTEAAS
jgi:site-specific recombinase XerD